MSKKIINLTSAINLRAGNVAMIENVNPTAKRAGTAAYKRYQAMVRFVAKHRGSAPVALVLDKTDYAAIDLSYDIAHGFIKVTSAPVLGPSAPV